MVCIPCRKRMKLENMIQNNDEWETEEEETQKGSRKITRDFYRPAYFGTSMQQRQIGRHKYASGAY